MTLETETTSGEKNGLPLRRARMPRAAWAAVAVAILVMLAAGGSYLSGRAGFDPWQQLSATWQGWFGGERAAGGVITAVAQRGDLEDAVTATGTLQPRDFVDVGTQVSGQLKKLHVQVGDIVTAGQLLAEIDPSVYQSRVDGIQAQLLYQEAQLADREAQLALATIQLTRQQNLDREGATTTEALQSAVAAQQSALAQTSAIRAQIKQTASTLRGDEANLGYTSIRAPIPGTVVSQAAKQGQTLNANQQAPIVMRIANLATMTVQAQVSEADVPKLKVGMDVYFTTLGGSGRRYYGKLRQIPPTPTVLNNVVLYDALFDVANPNQTLMTQMTAQVFFVVSSAKDAVLVPLAALRPLPAEGEAGAPRAKGAARKGGGERASGVDPRSRYTRQGALVSVVDDEGKVADREVRVGVMNRVSAQILSGLEPGEKVVIGTRAAPAAAKAGGSSALTPKAPRGGGRP